MTSKVSSKEDLTIQGSRDTNEQVDAAQYSMFGVKMGSMTVSCVGQADDSMLLSNDILQLGCLLHLTTQYCSKYKVDMTP